MTEHAAALVGEDAERLIIETGTHERLFLGPHPCHECRRQKWLPGVINDRTRGGTDDEPSGRQSGANLPWGAIIGEVDRDPAETVARCDTRGGGAARCDDRGGPSDRLGALLLGAPLHIGGPLGW